MGPNPSRFAAESPRNRDRRCLAGFASAARREHGGARRRIGRLLAWLAIVVFALSAPGCGGCDSGGTKKLTSSQDDIEKQREEQRKKLEEQKKKKKKPDFEMKRLQTQPNEIDLANSQFKPGHWTSATIEIRANNNDFKGDLVTDPFQLEGMAYRLGTSRPAILPKGQDKFLELVFYVPPGRSGAQINVRLTPPGSTRDLVRSTHPSLRMPEHQFNLVVLADDPQRYTFLKTAQPKRNRMGLDSIWPRGRLIDDPNMLRPHYRVMLPKIEYRAPLPSNPLTWTSTAYVLWDGLEPETLSLEQQQAMVDWIHWGGQLIVSGPGSLDLLQNSFLGAYLPASAAGDVEITGDDLKVFNQTWTHIGQPLKIVKPWSGKKLALNDAPGTLVLAGTQADGQGDPLVVERPVGRGRVVVTAFGLAQREIGPNNWYSFDNFFNGCLLRRPARAFFYDSEDDAIGMKWSDNAVLFDAHRNSAVRFFTRNARRSLGTLQQNFLNLPMDSGIPAEERESFLQRLNPFGAADSGNRPEQVLAGVAGWSDFNDPSTIGRHSLKQAAGIVIPKATFVVYILAAYLVVLVPVNWGFFRLLGRVEWAWIMAPVITIGFALAVVRLAELDIGFARARTELAVVELQGGYSRAHVTRYTALYTSLTTTYELQFDDPGAVVQPFPRFNRNEGREILRGQDYTTVHYRREDQQATLAGFEVSSNSTGMLHCEHMLDLGGGLRTRRDDAGRLFVVNGSELDLQGAGVIGPDGAAWLGRLGPGEEKEVVYLEGKKRGDWFEQRNASRTTAQYAPSDVLNVRLMARLAETDETMSKRELRLVAWTDTRLPGLRLEPAANQGRHVNVIVAHLNYGTPRRPKPDTVDPRLMAQQEALFRSPTNDPLDDLPGEFDPFSQ